MLWVLKRTVSMRDCSFENPKQMFKLMDKKIFTILRSEFFIYININLPASNVLADKILLTSLSQKI